jgi:hypothetical protein
MTHGLAMGRTYRQDCVLLLRAEGGKIAFLREYFDPVRAAQALDTQIAGSRYGGAARGTTRGFSTLPVRRRPGLERTSWRLALWPPSPLNTDAELTLRDNTIE